MSEDFGTNAQGEVEAGALPETDGPKATEDQATAQPEGAKSKGPAPWAKDLEERGLSDPNFDSYLREVWQPRVTQLEQQLADGGPYSELFGGSVENAQAAAGLIQALIDDPEQAYRELGDLLGISPAQAEELIDDALEGEDVEDGQQADPRLGWVEQQMQAQQEAAEDAAFDALLTELEGQIPGFDADLFTHMVLAYGDDLDAAIGAYMQWHREPQTETAPPTLGGGPGGVNPEENADDPGSIRDAIGDFLAESKARRAA